ncbi:putative invertase inhibitor [Capsicum galapagoense]
MYLRNISVFSISFFLFFLLLASQTKANNNSNLIEKACTIYNKPNWDFDFCIKLLNSDPKISSAQTPFDLAIAIIQAGNSHSSQTQDYINKKHSHESGTSPLVSSALSVCSKWYGGVVGAFVTALDDVQEKKFQSASDHVESANYYAMNCEEAFASRNVKDDGISKGDNLVMYFSLSAGVIINVLGGN